VLAIVYFGTVVYPDYVVWETGLGGRLDVTNVVHPVLCVITNIGRDHTDILFETLEQIAAEKAGIIKPGVPVVSGVSQPSCIQVIRETAASRKSALYLAGESFRIEPLRREPNAQSFHFDGPFRRIENVEISLIGEHQFQNAALAIMAMEVLRQYQALIVDDDVLYAGMKSARWPGRLEWMSENPRLLIDGAHNPEGMAALAATLAQGTVHYRRLHVLMGMISTKNHRETLRHIMPLANSITFTEPAWLKKFPAGELAAIAREVADELGAGATIEVESDWKKALADLLRRTEPGDLAVVTGTLYLISDVRSWLKYETESEKGW